MILSGPYSSFRSIVMNRFYDTKFILSAVPEALTAYDLPDLAAAFAPGKLFIADMTDGNGKYQNINDDLEIIKKAYQRKNAAGMLRIEPDLSVVDEWIR